MFWIGSHFLEVVPNQRWLTWRALSIQEKNPQNFGGSKSGISDWQKFFHVVVNPGTLRCPTMDMELVQTMRNVLMEHEILFGNSNQENGPTFLRFPLFLGIFQWDKPTKCVPFTAEPEIPEILTKWKAPGGWTVWLYILFCSAVSGTVKYYLEWWIISWSGIKK